MKYIFFMVAVAISCGCRPIFNAVYKFNREFTFTNRTEYLSFLDRSYSLAPEQVVYLDSLSEQLFIMEVVQRNISEYYGSFINDSVEIKHSSFLEENTSCIGRVLTEIEANSGKITDSLLVKNKNFRQYKLLNTKTDQQLALNADKKIKVFLLYTYRMGNYFNGFYKDVAALSKGKKDQLSIYVISLDPIRRLPK
jgi:hypothetical protein